MNSLVWKEANLMEIERQNIPEIKSDEVLIKVKVAGICGSEIEGYLGNNSLRVPPLVMGHEFAGEIEKVGSNVTHISQGERVVIHPLKSCMNCRKCKRGFENLCEKKEFIGIHRQGGFAQYVNVPASTVWKIPNHLDFYAASLTEPLACCVRAVRRVIIKHPFSNVIVFGAGTIGLLSALVAQLMGASNVIILDIQQERLNTAIKAGVQHALLSNDPQLKEEIDAIVGDKGVDAIVDAAGFLPTRQQAFTLINSGGTIMNIGLGIDETPLPINVAVREEISQEGSFSYTSIDFEEALNLLISGKIKYDEWTEVRKLAEGDQAFQDLVNHRVAKAKIFLEID